MLPAWAAFHALVDGDAPITARDVEAHCDLVGIRDAAIRALIYRGVIALRHELRTWQREQQEREVLRHGNHPGGHSARR